MLTVAGLPATDQAIAACQRCGGNSFTRLALRVGSRVSSKRSIDHALALGCPLRQ